VKLGAVNCDEEKSLCSEYSIQGFPTLKFFGRKGRPEDYPGGRDAQSMVAFGVEQWGKFAPPPQVRFLALLV
jgi:protein disulfide-isomerase A6